MASIYSLFDPRDGVVRYIGVTKHAPAVRLKRHCSDAARGGNHRSTWIRSLLSSGVTPSISVIEIVDGNGYAREVQVIAEYRALGYDLVNATDGGEGRNGAKATDATRAKMRANHLGATRSPEQRARMSAAVAKWWAGHDAETRSQRARVAAAARTPESWARISRATTANRTGSKHSAETKAKMSASAIARWSSQRDQQGACDAR